MIALVMFLLAPIVLVAHLLGASWGLAVVIAFCFPTVAFGTLMVVMFAFEVRSEREREKFRQLTPEERHERIRNNEFFN
jgi:hypothetical protein